MMGGSVRFSKLAERDLIDIAEHTLERWGEAQAEQYLSGIMACCERIAGSPRMGRPCPKVKPGYRRVEYGRHVLFYRAEADGVFIVRVLHGRMLPGKQAMEGGGGGL